MFQKEETEKDREHLGADRFQEGVDSWPSCCWAPTKWSEHPQARCTGLHNHGAALDGRMATGVPQYLHPNPISMQDSREPRKSPQLG